MDPRWRRALPLLAGLSAALWAAARGTGSPIAPAPTDGHGAMYARVRDSVVTVEVHSGNAEARHVLGSGYVVDRAGRVVTNYHVVGAFVAEPRRYQVRVRRPQGTLPARLERFDVINDLAVLRVAGLEDAEPLPLAAEEPRPGDAIVALGNPEGLGMSLIEGVFNGHARKGVVDRLLLSMPLNSGMSGGPILDRAGAVVGTNVAVLWLANSLSFGVPVEAVRTLLAEVPLPASQAAYRAEVTRQLETLEARTVERAVAPFLAKRPGESVRVGRVQGPRAPELYECWDSTQEYKDKGVLRSWHQCNLQFTPSVEELGAVGSVQLVLGHDESRGNSFGFYGALAGLPQGQHSPRAAPPDNGVVSAPQCRTDRVRAGAYTWHVSTCLNAYVHHPGFLQLDSVAVTVSQPRSGVVLGLHLAGFRLEPSLTLLRALLEQVRPGEGAS